MKLFFILFVIFFTKTVFSIEITVPIKIFEPLSKSSQNEIIGSSKTKIYKNLVGDLNNKSLQEIIATIPGIQSRSLYGDNTSGSKTTIDIRGMGAQAKSNVLILLNGQKLNNIDMSEIDFPSIPIDEIDVIEIYKGNSGTVLYGDGAIGGIINIITNPINKNKNNFASYQLGSFNTNNYKINLNNDLLKYNINTFINYKETDGYREENQQIQTNVSTKIDLGEYSKDFIQINYNEQIMSTPSHRTQSQLYVDRRGSGTPDDFINSYGGSLKYSTERKLSEKFDLKLNTSYRKKRSYYDLQSSAYPSYGDTTLDNIQFTPRINNTFIINNYNIESVLGIDLQRSKYHSFRKEEQNSLPLHEYTSDLESQAFYYQNNVNVTPTLTLGTGLRIQRNLIKISDNVNPNAPNFKSWTVHHKNFSDTETNYSYSVGLEKIINSKLNVFSRYGTGFRFPNIDDRIGGSGGVSFELDTQKSDEIEAGINFNEKFYSISANTYLIESRNELGYDSDSFVNININSTRRYGVELENIIEINQNLVSKNNFTYSKAKFTSDEQGSYATNFKDKDVPLVPQYSYSGMIEYSLNSNLKIIPSIEYRDDMRMESDDENFQNTKIPAILLFNFDARQNFKYFDLSVSIKNILDEKYFNYAVASSNTLGTYNAYPEPQREIYMSLGKNF